MDSFELGRLTDYDFEAVCCDLLGQILGVPLEIFAPGADQGIDLRFAGPGASGPLIVQCKQWERTGRAKLIRHMESEELPKIRRLNPGRYILATSAELTVPAKARILEILKPYVRTTGDIYGRDDIRAELRRRPEIVQRHFRLWLTGTVMIQTILNQDVFLRSAWLRDNLARRAATFVPHDGFYQAVELLKAKSTCIITGIPGVGKTTTATMLVGLLAADGYQVLEISEDMREASSVWQDGVRQVFFYDDFLGRTTLEPHLGKNEDNRLASFIRRVQDTPGKALVMTTRDYILQHARQRHELLAGQDVESSLSVVRLTDMTPEIRANILYNHVFHARIPVQEKQAFADPEAWEPVLGHRNFSPRIIEETFRLRTDASPAPEELLRNLDEPQRIWEQIVENELDDAAVHILEVVFACGRVSYEDLQGAWSRYQRELGSPADARAFRRGVRILEGTMLSVGANLGQSDFHNPSIEDYLRRHMNLGRTSLRALLRSLRDADHVTNFLDIATGHDSQGMLEQLRRMPEETADAIQAAASTVEDSPLDEDHGFPRYLAWALGIGRQLGSPELAEYVGREVEDLQLRLDHWHTSHLVELARAMSLDPWISRAFTEDFAGQVAERLAGAIEEAVAEGEWALAIISYNEYQDLPYDFSYAASAEFFDLALYETSRLADEEGMSRYGMVHAEAEVVGFLDSQFPGEGHTDDYEKLKQRIHAEYESRRATAVDALPSGAGFVSWPGVVPSGPGTRRSLGLLMGSLRQLQPAPQDQPREP